MLEIHKSRKPDMRKVKFATMKAQDKLCLRYMSQETNPREEKSTITEAQYKMCSMHVC